jgi:nitrogenase iron protein NifH
LARHFGNEEVAETILDRLATIYREKLEEIRGHLEGKRLMIFTWHYDVDWIIELAFDLGMEVCKVCVFNKPDYGRDKEIRTRFGDRIIFETDYPPSRRYAEIEEQAPDLVIANYIPSGMPSSAHYDTFSFCPDVGFFSGLKVAERWRRILLTPSVEGWRGDGDV